MKELEPFRLDWSALAREVDELQELLGEHEELSETEHILPFFQSRQNLSAFTASYELDVARFDRIAYEYPLFGDFRIDLVVGDSQSRTYCLVEFEDGSPNSVFTKTRRNVLSWSSRFEEGFSRIVDWFWILDDLRTAAAFERCFGSRDARFIPILVLGRSASLGAEERRRLRWRTDGVRIGSTPLQVYTYDDLLEDCLYRLETYPLIYAQEHQGPAPRQA